jgi:hypothetical protein
MRRAVLQKTLTGSDHAPEAKSPLPLKQLLKEQQAQAQALQLNPLYKQISRQLKMNRRDSGMQPGDEDGPPCTDDLEAEAVRGQPLAGAAACWPGRVVADTGARPRPAATPPRP